MKCLKDKLLNNLNNLNEKLTNKKQELENIQDNLYSEAINENNEINENNNNEYVVEGFFDGLGSLFSSTPANGLPVSPGTLEKQNLDILEKKITDRAKLSTSFPPKDDEDKKDSDNNDLLKSINGEGKVVNNIPNNIEVKKPVLNNIPSNLQPKQPVLNNIPSNLQPKQPVLNNIPSNLQPKQHIPSNLQAKQPVLNNLEEKQPKLQNMLGSCNFFHDKCPDDYQPLGNFSISGSGNNTLLTCGTVDKVKPAHAIAIIKSNSIYEINVTDPGFGFNPTKPPKIYIEGGKGNGATAEAIIDDNGYLKLIKIINPGYNYTETPNVIIDAPFMNSSCHLCCKM